MPVRLSTKDAEFSASLTRLLQERSSSQGNIGEQVRTIINEVKCRGDQALFEFTHQYDRLSIDASSLRVTEEEINQAVQTLDKELYAALELAAERIQAYHIKQRPQDILYADSEGNKLGWRWRAVPKVGLYVPGGKAAYPSSVLMNAIPALAAGVTQLAMVVPTPDGVLNHTVLAAAHIAGITEIYRIGGAQAIAALAYGTESVTKVDKIVGPGNQWVAEAKRQLFGTVGIDMIAGPSEICVVADKDSNTAWVAADLLSQAEHDVQAQSILIVDDVNLAEKIERELELLLQQLPRQDIARASWQDYGAVIQVDDVQDCASIIDQIAPEHLELCMSEPEILAEKVQCAGAIFMGYYTPEAFGDYVAGPSHVLPTVTTARFSSGLSVYDFINKQSLIKASAEGFQKSGAAGYRLAIAEGLDAHAISLQKRLKK